MHIQTQIICNLMKALKCLAGELDDEMKHPRDAGNPGIGTHTLFSSMKNIVHILNS